MSDNTFEQLVDQFYAALCRFALSLARSEADAVDLTQQTFFLWATKGDQLRDRTKAKSWLFTTLYREFLRRRRHDLRFPTVALDEASDDIGSVSPNFINLDARAVLAALQEIDETFRAPLTLFYLEQFSYVEIADVLGVPIGTVMSRLSRGKAHLRQRLSTAQELAARKLVPMKKGLSGG